MLRPVRVLLNEDGFLAAVLAGLVGGAVVVVLVRRGTTVLAYPFVAVVATLIGFRVGHRLSDLLVVALLLIAGGECLAAGAGSWAARFAFLVPGALVLAASLPDGIASWLGTTTVVATAMLAPLVVALARRDPRVAAVLFAVAGVGLYACVPDTEHARTLLGALLAAGVLGLDPALPAAPGASAVTGLFVWTAVVGGQARPGSVVGAIACLGVLVIAPLAGWARVRSNAPVLLIGVQVALVAFVSRVAGFRQSRSAAVALAIPALLIAFVILAGFAVVAHRRRV
jgi:hypothetical protein